MTRLEYIRSRMQVPRWIDDHYVLDIKCMDALVAAAEAVVKFSDLEPGYKGGAITEAAKKLMEEV